MPTILIADDEKNIRATLARALTLEGHAVHEAADGAQALERIEAGDIDLVILDLQMPVLDGLVACPLARGAPADRTQGDELPRRCRRFPESPPSTQRISRLRDLSCQSRSVRRAVGARDPR